MRRLPLAPWRSLRGRFLLVILLGMALPMALVGPWLARAARAHGEALLRERLEESLAQAANAVGHRWLDHRSLLLRVAESPEVVAALRDGETVILGPGAGELRRDWGALEGIADELVFRDSQGAVRGVLARADRSPARAETVQGSATLPVRIPVHDPASGAPVGIMDARLRLGVLLPAGMWWAGVGGSVLALFDGSGGTQLAPLSIPRELFLQDRFQWGGEEWLVVRRQLHEPAMRFALAAPVGPITAPFAEAARQGSLALLGVLLFGLALSTLLTRRVTGPLERLSAAADEVARGRFEGHVAEQGPEEIRRLGRAFNTMTESLRATLQRLSQREAVAAVGEFAASLAHEVRNPLTSIRLDLERARERLHDPARAEGLLERALRDIDRLDAAVSGSLRIARSGTLELGPVDLRQPIDAAMHAAQPAFTARGGVLEAWEAPDAPVLVRGNAGALEQLFLNLLLNAAEALEGGGSARVVVESTVASVRVSVQDSGPGIPAEVLGRVREAFFTTKEHGTGLGLPIAQRIAHAHGAELHLQSTPETGTTASITLVREAVPALALAP